MNMTKEEALYIIKMEQLTQYNWFGKGDTKDNEVGIREIDGKLHVYSTDERAHFVSVTRFDSESAALNSFIKRLRALQKYNQWYK